MKEELIFSVSVSSEDSKEIGCLTTWNTDAPDEYYFAAFIALIGDIGRDRKKMLLFRQALTLCAMAGEELYKKDAYEKMLEEKMKRMA